MGLQFNGRCVLSLDFDICGKPDRTIGVRTPCPFANTTGLSKPMRWLTNWRSLNPCDVSEYELV